MIILEFIITLGILLFLHELGHFLVARLFKIEVEEFGFGFPPRLARLFTLGGTEFTLNWIPFGAFVRPKGENDPDVPGGLGAASPWVRLAVLLGGPVMNILTGVVLFAVLFTRVGMPDISTIEIAAVAQESPAAIAGVLPGDVILAVNGEPIDSMEELSTIIQSNLEQSVTIQLLRNGENVEISAVPRTDPPEGQGALGIEMTNPVMPITMLQAVPYGVQLAYEQGKLLVSMPVRLIQGQVAPEEARFVGPKGMYDIYAQARERDSEVSSTTPTSPTPPAVNTLYLMATISVALGMTNLFPIPALDGGRIIFIIPEILLRRRVPAQYENMVHLIGFAALILLMVYITTQDFVNPIVLP